MLKRVENWLFYIFLFSIPISLRHIFGYQAFGYVEWTAKYIYATDILIMALFVFWIFKLHPSPKANVRSRVGEIEQKSKHTFYAVSRGLGRSEVLFIFSKKRVRIGIIYVFFIQYLR